MLDVEEEVLVVGSKTSRGVNCQRNQMIWSRMLLMTVSPMVVMPVIGLVLL